MTETIARRRHPFRASSLALAAALVANVAPCVAAVPTWVPESGQIDHATAQALVDTLVKDVEGQSLRPRDLAEYVAAKARLVALLATPAPTLDRHALYDAARTMLWTLDTDGHTLLWSQQQATTFYGSTTPAAAAQPSIVQTLPAPGGASVLVLRPPQATFQDQAGTRQYVEGLTAQANRALAATPAPCALVVDLDDQSGGSAWPAITALAALLTPANTARFVDRDGHRRPLYSRGVDAYFFGGTPPASDLARFAGRPFAVILGGQTVSAGEMLAIALRGEPQVRTFGRPTMGMTTSNLPTALPDGATVLLTIARYGYGDDPAIRGPLQPDFPADKGATPDATLRQAADWAARACGH